MSHLSFLRNASLAALLAATSAAAFSQGIITGKINGTVADPTGAVVPNATVVAFDKVVGQTYTVKANAQGDFSFSDLPVGDYTLTISMAGFGDLKLEHVVVETGKETGLGVEKLAPGSSTETVEVTGGQELLETTQSQVTTTFDSEQIQDLPTGGGLDQLALLVPGVAATHSAGFSNTNGVGLSSNGQRGRSNNFELDGQANNDNSVAGPQVFFQNQDALAELEIITNNFSAQYGRNMGSVVNYITKSGTNQIHGSGFEYYTGDFLSSYTQGEKDPDSYFDYCAPGVAAGTNGCRAPLLPRFVDNTYGGTLGFPIMKDKLWGFASTLWTRDLNGLTTVNSGSRQFPTQAGLQTLQATYPNNPGVAELVNYGPYAAKGNSTVTLGPTTMRTVCNVNATTCPAGTGVSIPFAEVFRSYNPHSYDQEHLGRLDYQMTPRDRFFLRYFYQNSPTIPDGSTASGAFYNVTDIAHSVGADWTHVFGPRWQNQVRYNFQQTTLAFDGGGFPQCTIKSLAGCPSTVTLSSPFLSLGEATNIPQGRVVKVTQVMDNASWSLGRHSITFGGEFDYQNSPNVFLPDINGAFTFSTLNSLLANAPSALALATGASPDIHFTEPDAAAYFQDDWKVTPSLTVNMGVRYEFFGQSLNLLHNTSLSTQTGSAPQWNTALPLSTTTFPYISPFKKGFEPRLGFAYNPEGMKKLVVRGGFAINFDPAYYNIALNSYSAAPVVNVSTFTGCNGTTVLCLPAGGAINSTVHTADDQYNPSGGNPGAKNQTLVTKGFHNPYAESYTLGVQYQVLRAATLEVRYSGNHTIGNFQSFNGNPTVGPHTVTIGGTPYQGVANFSNVALVPAMSNYFPSYAGSYCTSSTLNSGTTATTGDLGRENCGLTNVRVRGNTAFSLYNSLQTELQTRNLYGFTGSVAWTYGNNIDNTSEVFSTGTGGNTLAFAQNPYDIDQGERGLSATDYKNVTSAGLTYKLPTFGSKKSLFSRVVGGVELNTTYSFNSGQPYTPIQYYYSLIGYYYAAGYLNTAPAAGSPMAAGNYVGRGEGIFSTCDYNFNVAFAGDDVCRPFIGNPKAPNGTVALNTGAGYIDANGNPIQRSQARLVVNNTFEEIAQGTPFGNVQRNTFKGNSYNNVNFSMFKDFKPVERVNVQLQAILFNAFNRAYYGSPDPLMDDANNGVIGYGTFANFTGNSGSSFGPSEGSASGARNVQLGAKVQF